MSHDERTPVHGHALIALAWLAPGTGSAPEPVAPPVGTIECSVRLRGSAPAWPTIVPDKNVEHCGPALQDPVLLVRDGGIANAAVWIESEAAPPATLPAQELHLRSARCVMEPRIQTAFVGAVLVLENGDKIVHNPHAWFGDRTSFNVTLLDERVSVKRTLRQAGVYRIDCDTHSWMHAHVLVFPHPWHGVTPETGVLTLEGVPAGAAELVVWHEVLGEKRVKLQVAAGVRQRFEVEFELADRRPAKLIPPGQAPWIAR